jgi:hypothetical protein
MWEREKECAFGFLAAPALVKWSGGEREYGQSCWRLWFSGRRERERERERERDEEGISEREGMYVFVLREVGDGEREREREREKERDWEKGGQISEAKNKGFFVLFCVLMKCNGGEQKDEERGLTLFASNAGRLTLFAANAGRLWKTCVRVLRSEPAVVTKSRAVVYFLIIVADTHFADRVYGRIVAERAASLIHLEERAD